MNNTLARQLLLAPITIDATRYDLRRTDLDYLKYRGLAVRHVADGRATYTATDALRAIADPPRQSLSSLIGRCGLNEKNEIRNLRRRARYAQTLDWPKVWPSDADSRKLADLRQTNSTAEYVQLWCELNHLRTE